ncbi:MAG: DJ-1/PfpI family protein [Ruminococcus sp.]|nr:DJ-1/PfpI family protein [Ruminococcus sp.]
MIYCFLADGFEEIEAITTVDMIRRAGVEISTVAVTEDKSLTVKGAHGIPVVADMHIDDCTKDENLTGVFLPGGMPGTTNLDNSEKVRELVSYCAEKDRYLLAICAAPSVLGHMGLLEGKKATCYPGFEDELKGAVYTAQSAVQDGKIITGKGPGATVDFASLIISALKSEALASDLRSAMQCHE